MGAEAALGGATGTQGRRSNSSGGSTSSTCNPLQSVEEDLKKDNNTNNNVNGGGGMNDNPLSDDFRQHDDGEMESTPGPSDARKGRTGRVYCRDIR